MRELGTVLERFGKAIAIAGGVLFTFVFVIVLLNGRWPQFLRPVQILFAYLIAYLDGFSFVAEIIIFLGPGAAIILVGQWMQDRSNRKS